MPLLLALLLACGGRSTDTSNGATPPTEELVCDDGIDDDLDDLLDCDDGDCLYIAATGREGACVNKPDMRKYKNLDANVEWNKCVPGCLVDEACNTSCIAENTKLSEACSGCFAELITCFIGMCAGDCATQPPTPECGACVEANCLDDYGTCFGEPACEREYGCRDTVDNDGDGVVDAADPDCQE